MEIEIVNEWAQYENCDKIIFKGAGHCVNMDAPQEFNTYLENFLQKCRAVEIDIDDLSELRRGHFAHRYALDYSCVVYEGKIFHSAMYKRK